MADHDDIELTRTHRAGDRPVAAAPTSKWGEFTLVRELGRGAFGRVYHAHDATLARDIALKVVRLPDQADAAAALGEGRLLARVRHRNVVTVYGAQQIGDEVGLWMELIHGRSLADVIREQGPLGSEEATVVGISLCQALAAVHAAGLLHRDVKANNVMRESGGRIVLADFGTGRDSAHPAEQEDFAGTPVYMAPEVLAGAAASVASDLYSLGVLLFFAVTAEYPVRGASVLDLLLAHKAGQRRLLSDARPDLPDGFVRVVERALAPRPEDRHASAGAMMRALADALPSSTSWEGRLARALSEAGAEPSLLLHDRRPPLTTGMVIARGVMAGFAATIAVGLLGFLTSAAFNQALLRDDFSSDSALDWWVFGARSLVAPLILGAVSALAVGVCVATWRALRRVVPAKRTAADAALAETRRGGSMTRFSSPALAQWLLVAQLAGLAIVGWRFRHLLQAVTQPGEAPAPFIALLSNHSDEALLYRGALSLLLWAMVIGWYAILSRPGAAAFIPPTTKFAGAAAMLCALFMLEVPYRLLYHNEFTRVTFAGARCYEIGRSAREVLLYCPDAEPPRIQRVTKDDVRLPPAGVIINESIFP
jgi:serine/threonine-protein kinase